MESSIKSDAYGSSAIQESSSTNNLDSENSPTGADVMRQGSQGIQLKNTLPTDELAESPRVDEDDGQQKMYAVNGDQDHEMRFSAFDPNTTQTNDLLNIRDNRFNLVLQQVYYSDKCQWFYILLLLFAFILILVTIWDGFKVAESPAFIILELLLNLLIGADFACRVKLVGCERYFRDP